MNRREQIAYHGFNPDKVWYHGTGHDIKAFDYNYLGKGNDGLGVGFYFTTNPHIASSYGMDSKRDLEQKGMSSEGTAPNVIPVHLKLKKAVPTEKSLTRTQVSKIIKNSPNLMDNLSNFGDIDHYGAHKILNDAVSGYTMPSAYHALGMLYNDFYRDKPKEFLTAVTKHTGYDHVITHHEQGDIAAVFHPEQIRSIHAAFDLHKIKSHNIMESLNIKKAMNEMLVDKVNSLL